MARFGKQAGVVALLLGGLAVIAPTFLSGTTRLGGYGGTMTGYGGMMGSYGGMMAGYGGMGGYNGMMGGYGAGGTIFGFLGQLGFLVLLVGGGFLLYRALTDNGNTTGFGSSDPAMVELRRAYARGDVSEEEFETRRNHLRQESEP